MPFAPRAALAALALLAAPALSAQDARLAGTFALNRGASDDVVAIGLRAAGLPGALRVMARTGRGRQMVNLLAPPTVSVTPDGQGRLTIRTASALTLTPGGPPVAQSIDNGRRTLEASAVWEGPRLVVTQQTGTNRSTDTYALDAQGRLTVHRQLVLTVKRDGERRATPIQFRLVYDKA